MEAAVVEVIGDSELVIQQIKGEYKCSNSRLAKYVATTIHAPRDENQEANDFSQLASPLDIEKWPKLKFRRKSTTTVSRKRIEVEIRINEIESID